MEVLDARRIPKNNKLSRKRSKNAGFTRLHEGKYDEPEKVTYVLRILWNHRLRAEHNPGSASALGA